jgi:hypothetical protein
MVMKRGSDRRRVVQIGVRIGYGRCWRRNGRALLLLLRHEEIFLLLVVEDHVGDSNVGVAPFAGPNRNRLAFTGAAAVVVFVHRRNHG